MTTMTEPGTATQLYQLYIKASQEEVWKAITDPVTAADDVIPNRAAGRKGPSSDDLHLNRPHH